ncbi:MAG: AEC family transporter [Anaerovoracaceae bacterium]|nr:AEC family transporter [Anaerovoracaceae bacterium]
MFENFIISLEAVAPMFIIMAIGVLLRKRNFLNETEVKKLNKLVFNVFFPCLMFSNIYGAEVGEAFDKKLILYCILMILAVFFTAMAVIVKIEPENKNRGAMIQAIYRSNFVIMGIPIVSNIFGGEQLATAAIAVTIVVPLFNVLAVVVLEIFRGGKPSPLHILKGIAKNPLIIGAVLGILTIPFHIVLPDLVENVVYSLKDVATPMALVILGMSLNLKDMGEEKRNLMVCVLGRLVIVPAVALTVGALIGLRGVSFVTLIAVFASPTAVSSFTMAEQMDSNGQLAANAVVFSSALASVTMFCWIFLFKSLGMF